MQCGVAGSEGEAGALGEAGLQTAPDRALASGRAADHGGVVRQLADHPHLRGEAMGCTVLHQAAVDAVSGSGGAAGDVGGIDVKDLQRLGAAALNSLRG